MFDSSPIAHAEKVSAVFYIVAICCVIHGYVTSVLERMRYQRETGRFCDVSIVVKDRQFSAHRNILASCSPYFDSILKSTKVTKEQVMVNCQYPNAFELLLNYMYSGCVVIDRSTVAELLRLANNFLAASEYFDVNINRCLLESVDILHYSMSQLVKIIEDPKYQDVISPDVHLKLIVRWVGEDVGSREASFRHLLEGCPVTDVSDSTLEFLLDYSPLLTKSQTSRYLLLHTMHENNMPMSKYEPQFISLSQQLGGEGAAALLEAMGDYEEDENDSW
uniref:BTB domain-containing protein n=1 Tax=Heterorhabditis bacteriophora TaxID=37862 RepID=A0A1I7XAF1_HETBA